MVIGVAFLRNNSNKSSRKSENSISNSKDKVFRNRGRITRIVVVIILGR